MHRGALAGGWAAHGEGPHGASPELKEHVDIKTSTPAKNLYKISAKHRYTWEQERTRLRKMLLERRFAASVMHLESARAGKDYVEGRKQGAMGLPEK